MDLQLYSRYSFGGSETLASDWVTVPRLPHWATGERRSGHATPETSTKIYQACTNSHFNSQENTFQTSDRSNTLAKPLQLWEFHKMRNLNKTKQRILSPFKDLTTASSSRVQASGGGKVATKLRQEKTWALLSFGALKAAGLTGLKAV